MKTEAVWVVLGSCVYSKEGLPTALWFSMVILGHPTLRDLSIYS